MEIEIPDLQDLTFTESCRECWGGGFKSVPSKHSHPASKVMCEACHGTGHTTTAVGRRLIEFLTELGITIPKSGGVM